MSKPEIIAFQMQHDDFLYCGKEYPRKWYEYMDAWGDFDKSGGWDMVMKYRNNPAYKCTVVNHLTVPEGIYMAGTFVDNMTEVPEGFVLRKFPACEFLVVTHEWQPNSDMLIVEDAVKSIQIPDGYVKYDKPDSIIRLIEVENNDPEKGSRWENWIPIKKV
ncbi:MAG: effector binding domain-containing protein [Clostridia bacterium]|nr:effector binding domain-containing protein [Clostridia bacterium]